MSGCFDDKGIDAELEKKADALLEPIYCVPTVGMCIRVRVAELGPDDFDISKILKERDGK